MSWRNRIAGMIEFVTDIVMDSDGMATSQGMDEDDKIDSVAGWQFGFYSRPKDSARGLVVKADGQGNTSVLLCVWDRQYELTLEKGEVGIQNAFSASILLNDDGEVVFNGGTKKVARVDDTTACGSLMFIPGTGGAALTYLPPGAPIVVPPGATQIDLEGIIDSGADKVKA